MSDRHGKVLNVLENQLGLHEPSAWEMELNEYEHGNEHENFLKFSGAIETKCGYSGCFWCIQASHYRSERSIFF